ncbi:MAG: hypothetical protein NTW49_10710 [Bacteroidia bacterium]|nr:hypothetical protein [Bacteroidia bacterium]
MKHLLFFALTVLAVTSMSAQNTGFFMIFSASGEATLTRNGVLLAQPAREKLANGNILHIGNGTVVLLDKNNKRVTITKQGDYSFTDIQHLFEQANASIANKYLVYIWEKMANVTVNASRKGGVVRGENEFLFPPDSAVVFSDTLVFKYLNQEGLRWKLSIEDISEKLITEYYSAGSLIIITKPAANWWKPGTFKWNLNIPGEKSSGPCLFTIADAAARKAFLTEWKQITEAVSGLPKEEQEKTLKLIIELKKWVP